MSTEKVVRYTAEEMREVSKRAAISSHRHALVKSTALAKRDFEISEMLAQAARTESDVAGLVEALRNVLSADGAFDKLAAEKDAKAELARFQP